MRRFDPGPHRGCEAPAQTRHTLRGSPFTLVWRDTEPDADHITVKLGVTVAVLTRILGDPIRVVAHRRRLAMVPSREWTLADNTVFDETSLIAPVPEAERLVRRWRDRFDPWADQGIPAHITIAAPFLPLPRITDAVLERLRTVAADQAPPVVVFDRVVHLPSLLPADDGELNLLTSRLTAVWPDVQAPLRTGSERPYHLTAACSDDERVFKEIADALQPILPITARVDCLHLVAHDARTVRTVAELRIGPFPNRTRQR